MDASASVTSDMDIMNSYHGQKRETSFLDLPRELRDQIYDDAFNIPDNRGERALRIERRNLRYFAPSAPAIILLLHHECFLLNRQIAREALEILFKKHTVFLSCGPHVLKSVLERIEAKNGPEKQWLKWIKSIELEWVTFPNLRCYPPLQVDDGDEWHWNEQHDPEVDVEYVRGAQLSGHRDEYDYEGRHYDDNFYQHRDSSLYPSPIPQALNANNNAAVRQPSNNPNDPFGFANLYPFPDPDREPTDDSEAYEDVATKLDLLVSLEVTPLFSYFCSSALSLESITLPLYFISKEMHQYRSAARPDYLLPTKIRYWVKVCVHALQMLTSTATTLKEVKVKYLPWEVWASMDPADDLYRMTKKGVLFNKGEDWVPGNPREHEGEAFRSVWKELQEQGLCDSESRMGLKAEVKFVKWEGDLDKWRVGDELEVVFTMDVTAKESAVEEQEIQMTSGDGMTT